MTYSDAIEQVMLNNGYFAPLKLLYSEVWKYKDKDAIHGKTPIATIQERVQRDNRFTKIGYGVYALTDKLPLLNKPAGIDHKKDSVKTRHREMQGMLLEIGNNRNDVAFTYTADRTGVFQNKNLGGLATLKTVPPFTYEKIIKDSVSFIDVLWFNERKFPSHVFEVESSTDFRDGFIKFMELQDFVTRFICVSPEERRDKFDREIEKSAFKPIRNRIEFLSYEAIESDYNASLIKLNL
jgi:hypothetical protein